MSKPTMSLYFWMFRFGLNPSDNKLFHGLQAIKNVLSACLLKGRLVSKTQGDTNELKSSATRRIVVVQRFPYVRDIFGGQPL